MPKDLKIYKLLRKLEKINNGGNIALDIDFAPTKQNPLGNSLILYLWVGKSVDTIPQEKVNFGEHLKCFVAYNYFDFRHFSQPLICKTKVQKRRYLSIHEVDEDGFWISTFDVNASFSSKMKYQCEYDETKIDSIGKGLEKVVSKWSSNELLKNPIPLTISISIE